jgi:hypothetical protein
LEFVEYLEYEIRHRHGFNSSARSNFVEMQVWENRDLEQQLAAWAGELRKGQHFGLRPWHDQGGAVRAKSPRRNGHARSTARPLTQPRSRIFGLQL